MRVGMIGTGYVGLVAGACFAETGNDVICGDVDAEKVAALNDGRIPIYEPGLEPLVARNVEAGRLRFTTDIAGVARESEVIFIAVGTPPDEDGSADLRHVLDVAAVIGNAEETGEKLYRDDRYLAQLRIGEVTFYVEYSVADAGGYRVHTGYAHKALILDE